MHALYRCGSVLNLDLTNVDVWIESMITKQTLDQSAVGKPKTVANVSGVSCSILLSSSHRVQV